VLGHYTSKGGWVFDEVKSFAISATASYTLELTGKGLTVSLTVNGSLALSHVYNAVVVDGKFGLISINGAGTFSQAYVRTDDDSFQANTQVQHQNAASTPTAAATGEMHLTSDELASVLNAAIDRLSAALVLGASDIASLRATTIEIADLPGLELGLTIGNSVTISASAAGWGWYIDPTPYDDSEFQVPLADGRAATPASPAYGEMDLLTVVMHELAHIVGYGDTTSGLMAEDLPAGTRLAPPIGHAKGDSQALLAADETVALGNGGGVVPSSPGTQQNNVSRFTESLIDTLGLGALGLSLGAIPPSAIGSPAAPTTTRVFHDASGAFVGAEDSARLPSLLDALNGSTVQDGRHDWVLRGPDQSESTPATAANGHALLPGAEPKPIEQQSDSDEASDNDLPGLLINWNKSFAGFESGIGRSTV
jgi:hypothetical protein